MNKVISKFIITGILTLDLNGQVDDYEQIVEQIKLQK